MTPMIVIFTVTIGDVIIAEASLSIPPQLATGVIIESGV